MILPKLKRLVRNVYLDIIYGGKFLGGTIPALESQGAVTTANTDYAVMPYIFINRLNRSDVLVDVGCGKGRIINWLLHNGYQNEIIGVELNPSVAESTKKRLRKYRNVSIIAGSILQNIPLHATMFYLFNPFHRRIMIEFKIELEKKFCNKSITLIYYNCRDVDIFENDNLWTVTYLESPQHKLALIKLIK